MLTTRFLPHAVQLDTAGSVAAWIDQVESLSPDMGVELFEESAGSEVDREYVAVKAVKPTLPIVTSDLSFIATCGMLGVYISPSSGHPGLIAYGRQLPLGAVPTAIATAAHLKCAVTDGLLVPVSMSASHNNTAKLNLMLHAILGGDAVYSGAKPMIFSTGQAIASGASQLSKLFTAGVVKFNSTLLQGIKDLQVQFGLQILKESDSGDVYDSQIAIVGRASKIMFTTADVESIAAIGDGLSVTSCAAYFRKVAQNGQRVAIGTSQHVSAIGTAGMITPGAMGLQHQTPGTQAYTYTPSKNTALLTLSAASTIPAS